MAKSRLNLLNSFVFLYLLFLYLWCRSKSRQPWKESRGKIVSPAAHKRPTDRTHNFVPNWCPLLLRPVSVFLGWSGFVKESKLKKRRFDEFSRSVWKSKLLKVFVCLLKLTIGACHNWKICWMIVQSTYDPQCSVVLKLEGRKKEATLTFMVYQLYHGPVHRLLTIWPGRQFVKGHQHTHTVRWLLERGETVTRAWVSGVFALATVLPALVQN